MKRILLFSVILCGSIFLFSPSYLQAQTIYTGLPSGYNPSGITDTTYITPIADSIIDIDITLFPPIDSTISIPPFPDNPWLPIHPHIIPGKGSFAIDTTMPGLNNVGEIPINHNISPTGATIYQVPVNVIPGRNGLQPNLAIIYNSQSGDGMLGVGWSLSGLSAITRGNFSVYYDGKTEVMNTSLNTPFLLDGNRLIKTHHLGHENHYITEQGNIKVIGVIGINQVKYFKVFYPNGSIAVFGNENAAVNADYSYPITKLTDSYGNEMIFNYTQYGGHNHINHIDYGANTTAGFEHFARVKFNYKSRTDSNMAYILGSPIYTKARLLKNIVCTNSTNGSNILHTYSFSYKQQPNSSLLTKIDYSTNNVPLNPLQFHYGFDNQTAQLKVQETRVGKKLSTNKVLISKGQFNPKSWNDGLLVYPNKNPYRKEPVYTVFGIKNGDKFVNDYSADDKIIIYLDVIDGKSVINPPNINVDAGFITAFCADIDGNGKDEVVKINHNRVNGDYEQVTFSIFDKWNYGTGTFSYPTTFSFDTGTVIDDCGVGTCRSVHPKRFLPGNYTGNGKIEVLAIGEHRPLGTGKTSFFYLFDINEKSMKNLGTIFPAHFEDAIFAMDYNGDGKTDICHIGENGTTIYSYNSSSLVEIASAPRPKRSDLRNGNRDRAILLGDINGDGKTDIVMSPLRALIGGSLIDIPNPDDHGPTGPEIFEDSTIEEDQQWIDGSNIWSIYYSKGSNISDCFKNEQQNIMRYREGDQFALHDMDGDGRPDLVFKRSHVNFFKNINDIFTPRQSASTLLSQNALNLIPTNVTTENYYTKFLALDTADTWRVLQVTYSRDEAKENLLTGVVNSFGVIAKTDYESVNDFGTKTNATPFYACPSSQAIAPPVFPYSNYVGPLWVTTKTQTSLDNTVQSSMEYSYGNVVVHRLGLGFRGFDFMNMHDRLKNKKATQFYDPYRFSVLRYEESDMSKTSYTFNVNIAANKKARVTLAKQTSNDKLTKYQTQVTYLYDEYDNPTQEKISYDYNTEKTTTNIYQYKTIGSGYVISLPLEQQVATKRGSDTWNTKSVYTYTQQNKPASQIDYVNNNKVLAKQWTYDAVGNMLSVGESLLATDRSLTTRYEYDTQKRFLVNKKDTRRLQTTYNYDTQKGLLLSEQDYKGNITSYEYNALGKCIKTINPDGTIVQQNTQWAGKDNDNAIYSITTTATQEPETRTYYDAFGREIKSYTESFDGTKIYTENQYDNFGRLRTNITTAGATTYNYDDFDRTILIIGPAGDSVTYSYSNGKNTIDTLLIWEETGGSDLSLRRYSVTETKHGIATTTAKNILGEVVEIINPAGSIEYILRADGQPSKIKAAGIETTFEYDNYGRQTKLIDPSAGTQLYEYDEYGRLTKQTDAKGLRNTISYNSYGQVIEKGFSGAEFPITYTYGTDGMLLKENRGELHVLEYTYDNLNRLKNVKETINAKEFRTEYQYTNGKLIRASYPTLGYSTSYTYNERGYRTDVLGKSNNNNIFGGKTIERGAPTENGFSETIEYTNNYRKQKDYNRYGMQTAILSERNAMGGYPVITMLDEQYEYNVQKHLLTSRSNNKSDNNFIENFEYDQYRRLTVYGVNGERVEYSNTGNILEKTDAGRYSYNSNRPYAITKATQFDTNAFPATLQNINYTSFKRPSSIHEGKYSAYIDYGVDNERTRMDIYEQNDSLRKPVKLFTRYYFAGGKYELTDYVSNYVYTPDTSGITLPGNDKPIGGGGLGPIGLFGVAEITPQVHTNQHALDSVFDQFNPGDIPLQPDPPTIDFHRPDGIAYSYYSDRILYVDGSPYSASIAYTPDKTSKHHFIIRDRQGSVRQITNDLSQLVAEYFYDAWGRQTDEDGTVYSTYTEPLLLLGRGYTGHEHLPWFNLINMNARLYDPVVGRFLSPDPYVQAPSELQNFNRYSYCMNNPLMYIDQDGEFWHIIIGAVIGGVINVITNWDNIDNFWEGISAFGVGAGAGALTAINPALGAIVGGAATNAANSIIGQTGNGVGLGDVNWGTVGKQAGIGAAVGAVTYGVGSAINKTGLTDKILNGTGIINSSARNIVGSTINGTLSGTTTGFVGGIITGVTTGEWNLWTNTWKGAAFGTAAGLTYGVTTELAYQAQLKWGRNNVLNSDVADALANSGDNAIRQMNGEGRVVMLDGVTVVYDTQTGITTTYINANPNGYWLAPLPYQVPTNPNILMHLLKLR